MDANSQRKQACATFFSTITGADGENDQTVLAIVGYLHDVWSEIRKSAAAGVRKIENVPLLVLLLNKLCASINASPSNWQSLHGSILGINAIAANKCSSVVIDPDTYHVVENYCFILLGNEQPSIQDSARECLTNLGCTNNINYCFKILKCVLQEREKRNRYNVHALAGLLGTLLNTIKTCSSVAEEYDSFISILEQFIHVSKDWLLTIRSSIVCQLVAKISYTACMCFPQADLLQRNESHLTMLGRFLQELTTDGNNDHYVEAMLLVSESLFLYGLEKLTFDSSSLNERIVCRDAYFTNVIDAIYALVDGHLPEYLFSSSFEVRRMAFQLLPTLTRVGVLRSLGHSSMYSTDEVRACSDGGAVDKKVLLQRVLTSALCTTEHSKAVVTLVEVLLTLPHSNMSAGGSTDDACIFFDHCSNSLSCTAPNESDQDARHRRKWNKWEAIKRTQCYSLTLAEEFRTHFKNTILQQIQSASVVCVEDPRSEGNRRNAVYCLSRCVVRSFSRLSNMVKYMQLYNVMSADVIQAVGGWIMMTSLVDGSTLSLNTIDVCQYFTAWLRQAISPIAVYVVPAITPTVNINWDSVLGNMSSEQTGIILNNNILDCLNIKYPGQASDMEHRMSAFHHAFSKVESLAQLLPSITAHILQLGRVSNGDQQCDEYAAHCIKIDMLGLLSCWACCRFSMDVVGRGLGEDVKRAVASATVCDGVVWCCFRKCCEWFMSSLPVAVTVPTAPSTVSENVPMSIPIDPSCQPDAATGSATELDTITVALNDIALEVEIPNGQNSQGNIHELSVVLLSHILNQLVNVMDDQVKQFTGNCATAIVNEMDISQTMLYCLKSIECLDVCVGGASAASAVVMEAVMRLHGSVKAMSTLYTEASLVALRQSEVGDASSSEPLAYDAQDEEDEFSDWDEDSDDENGRGATSGVGAGGMPIPIDRITTGAVEWQESLSIIVMHNPTFQQPLPATVQ